MKKYIYIDNEVKQALQTKRPVIALESSIIAQGMPFPENDSMAKAVETIIRNEGGVPATIALIDGVIKVGLTNEEIEFLSKNGSQITKAGKRDLPYLISKGLCGATTVASTAYIASLVGIKIFATGGIGGVHRNGENSFDISNDLDEIANCNITIVTAGAKAILDLALTLEYLETKGVEVIGYKTNFFPAFYSAKSPFPINHRLDSPQEIANLLEAKQSLQINTSTIIANPIPEKYEIKAEEIETYINEAIISAKNQGVFGKALTPFLLTEIAKQSNNRSLDANLALIFNNALLASKIAKLL